MITHKIAENVYLFGFNDRRTELFENIWPLPNGVSYNCYLLKGSKNILIDTAERKFTDELFEALDLYLVNEKLDTIILNHVEPDHSGILAALVVKYPNIEIICSQKHKELLEGFYGLKANYNIVKDGEGVGIGGFDFTFYTTPMVHWPDSSVTYEATTRILFSNDSFGSFSTLDGGVFDHDINLSDRMPEVMRYYTNIVGKYGKQTAKALEKLAALTFNIIAPSHGFLWSSNIEDILNIYAKWSNYESENGAVIIFGSMYGNTEKAIDSFAQGLSMGGCKNIKIFDVSKTHPSYILSKIFKYKGLVIATPVYNGGIFPPMNNVLNILSEYGIKDRLVALIGSYSWGGAPLKKLDTMVEENKWILFNERYEFKGSPDKPQLNALYDLGCSFAKEL